MYQKSTTACTCSRQRRWSGQTSDVASTVARAHQRLVLFGVHTLQQQASQRRSKPIFWPPSFIGLKSSGPPVVSQGIGADAPEVDGGDASEVEDSRGLDWIGLACRGWGLLVGLLVGLPHAPPTSDVLIENAVSRIRDVRNPEVAVGDVRMATSLSPGVPNFELQ